MNAEPHLSEAISSPTCQTETLQDIYRESAAVKHIHVVCLCLYSCILCCILVIFAADNQISPQESIEI